MQTTTPAPETTPTTPGQYVPVQGGETHSGQTLLVQAYMVLWIILMAWLFFVWRKQARLHTRLDELEKVLDRAASQSEKGPR